VEYVENEGTSGGGSAPAEASVQLLRWKHHGHVYSPDQESASESGAACSMTRVNASRAIELANDA
jgi:hypothetical protein